MEEDEPPAAKPPESIDCEKEDLDARELRTTEDDSVRATPPPIQEFSTPVKGGKSTPLREDGNSDERSNAHRKSDIPSPPADPTTSDGSRKYRTLFHEIKRKYLIQQKAITGMEKERETLIAKVAELTAESEQWREKYEARVDKSDLEKITQDLTAENSTLKEVNERLRTEMEGMKTEYEKIISDKDELLNERSAEDKTCHGLHRINSEEHRSAKTEDKEIKELERG